jgi:hypothetical protein
MIRQREQYDTISDYLPSDSSSSDNGTMFERPSKARKSNIYDAVAGNRHATNKFDNHVLR